MTKGNNRYGAAGKGGIPAPTLLAFLDHYTYEADDNLHQPGSRAKFLNGKRVPDEHRRSIRRYRSGDTTHVSAGHLFKVLTYYGFDLPWFQGWAKLHRKPLTG